MESLGPRPRNLSIPSEREATRRIQVVSLSLLAGFSVAAFAAYELLPPSFTERYSAAIGLAFLAGSAAIFAILLRRASQRELAMIRLNSVFIEGLPVGVLFLDEAARVTYANAALAQTVLGRPPTDILGRSAMEFIHADDRARVGAELRKRREGANSTYEVRVLRANGTIMNAVITAAPFQDDGKFDGAMAVIVDATDVLDARARAVRYRDLASFALDSVTHDLSNRMVAVIAKSQLAGAFVGKDEEKTRKAIAGVESAADQAVRLIREVKQIADAERQNWPSRRMMVREVLLQALEMADIPPPVAGSVDVAPAAENQAIEASDLGALCLAKLLEQAAEAAVPERAGAKAEISADIDDGRPGVVIVRIRGYRKMVSDGDLAQMLEPPGAKATIETRWRSGVKLALASSIAQAKGWQALAVREGEGVVFELAVAAAKE